MSIFNVYGWLNIDMRFNHLISRISPTLLLERYYKYNFPTAPEKQLYDFYMLDYLKTVLDYPPASFRELPTDLEDSVNDAVKTLYPKLREELLDAVYYALVSELRHVESNKGNRQFNFTDSINTKLFKSYLKYMVYHSPQMASTSTRSDLDVLGVRKPTTTEEPPSSEQVADQEKRNQSFKASKYAIKKNSSTLKQFVKMCEEIQDRGDWDKGYGGKNWADICRGWILLWDSDRLNIASGASIEDSAKEKSEKEFNTALDNAARKKGIKKDKSPSFYDKKPKEKKGKEVPMAAAIDHVYDLQHNNGTVFDKLKRYYQDNVGYEWIMNALDYRANLKDYHDLMENSSGTVKAMAMPILYNRFGQTWEKHISTETPTSDELESRYDKTSMSSYSRAELTDLFNDKNTLLLVTLLPRHRNVDHTTIGKPYKVYKYTSRMSREGCVIKGDNKKPIFVPNSELLLLTPKKSSPEEAVVEEPSDNTNTPTGKTLWSSGPDPDLTHPWFKVGDKIECIEYIKGTLNIHLGGVYEVMADGYSMIQIWGDDGEPCWVGKDGFKVITPATKPDSSQPPTTGQYKHSFKVGDMVKCVNATTPGGQTFHFIKLGEVYKVSGVEGRGGNERIKIQTPYGTYTYKPALFELVSPENGDATDKKEPKKDRLTQKEILQEPRPEKSFFKAGDWVTVSSPTRNVTPGMRYRLEVVDPFHGGGIEADNGSLVWLPLKVLIPTFRDFKI